MPRLGTDYFFSEIIMKHSKDIMSVINISKQAATSSINSRISNKIVGLAAIALGAIFIAIVGFSPIEVVHNAAHDTRHSTAFPCH